MATLKAEVQSKRKDGTYIVYIRVTHNRRIAFLKTPWIVYERGVIRGKKEISDPYVCQQTSKLIEGYYQLLNRVDTQNWTLPEVVEYLRTGSEDLSFTDYANSFIDKMVNEGRERTAKNYKCAVRHIHRYANSDSLMFSRMNSSFLIRWIETLMTTSRCKESYPICVREIFKSAIFDYNDEENDVIRIKNPWSKIVIPKSDTTDKRAIPIRLLRKFFRVVPDDSKFKHPLQELGQDVAKISVCMCGINTIDLFEAKKEQLTKDGVFWYNRAKTKTTRTDKAYFEIKIPAFLMPTIEKYLSHNPKSPWLFNFHERLSTGDSFNANVNIGIDQICEKVNGMKANFGAFRHTWATIAQNDCGASLGDVDFGLNHSTNKMARVYTKIDFSPAWRLNEKVMEFIFFSDKVSEVKANEKEKKFEKLSKYNLIKGEAFLAGKVIAKVENTGFSNIDQVITTLMEKIPSGLPSRTKIQIRITNKDKDLCQFYERCI